MFSSTRSLVFLLAAPAVALIPAQGASLSPTQSVALHASFDPSLGSMRAGRAAAAHGLDAGTRAGLHRAQAQAGSLASMRAGFEMSDNEWKWLAIGAGVVVLIVLL
jgi:hypothetical protein